MLYIGTFQNGWGRFQTWLHCYTASPCIFSKDADWFGHIWLADKMGGFQDGAARFEKWISEIQLLCRVSIVLLTEQHAKTTCGNSLLLCCFMSGSAADWEHVTRREKWNDQRSLLLQPDHVSNIWQLVSRSHKKKIMINQISEQNREEPGSPPTANTHIIINWTILGQMLFVFRQPFLESPPPPPLPRHHAPNKPA